MRKPGCSWSTCWRAGLPITCCSKRWTALATQNLESATWTASPGLRRMRLLEFQ